MKKLPIILLIFLAACANDKKSNDSQTQSKKIVFAIITDKEGKNLWSLSIRTIYIKEVQANKVIWDTLWEYPKNLPLKDSTGKPVVDSTGQPVLNPEPVYVPIGKDSVRWQGIEGVGLDSLIKSTKPRNAK